MSTTNNEIHLSTVNKNIYSDDLISKDARNLTHLWGINPVTYLAELQQQSRISKLVDLQKTLTTMPQSSTSTLEKDENLSAITNSLNHLRAIRVILSELKDSDIETATQFGRDIMLITNDLLLRVVKQIGQTNVQTPTFESVIAYIRSLIHTRSAHMRQTIPGSLLITWYEVSQLMSSMQKEPELRITIKRAKQLLDIAHDTAIWAYKHLSTERTNNDQIGFIDRSSIPYTYE